MKKLLLLVFLCFPFALVAQNTGVGTSNPLEFFSVGASSQFRVNSSGNIVRINDVAYSFPASQATTGSVLANDGSGNLTWTKVTAGNISATGTPDATTYLRGDGSWQTPAGGGAEQFPSLESSNSTTGTISTYRSWTQIYSTTATSTGKFLIVVELIINSSNFNNALYSGVRIKVAGSVVGGSEGNYLSFAGSNAGTGPGYITATHVGSITSGQSVTVEYAINGNLADNQSIVSPSSISIIKLSN